MDGVAELEPELEMGSVCGWGDGGGCPDSEDAELEDEPELGALACCLVPAVSDVPLVDEVVVLDERVPDAGCAGVWTRVGR